MIDEKQLRVAFKNKSTKAFAFYGIACRQISVDYYGISHNEQVRVYGNKTKTVAITWKEGYKDCQKILGKFPATGTGYADAALAIENYFQ